MNLNPQTGHFGRVNELLGPIEFETVVHVGMTAKIVQNPAFMHSGD